MDENRDAWDLYCAMQTQWRASGFGVIGLDYAQIWPVAELLEIDVTQDVFRKIRLLEAEELKKQTAAARNRENNRRAADDQDHPGDPGRKKPPAGS